MRQLRDDFRKLKAANSGYLLAFYLLAFGLGDFFEFRYCDAEEIVAALPDVRFDDTVDYKLMKVHKLGFYPFVARLSAKGLKVATVARSIRKGKPSYRISGRADD